MNHETDTPRTDALPSTQTMLTAQSDPVELYHQLIAATVDYGKALDACVEYRKQLDASQAEVRELNILMIGWKMRTAMCETDLETSKAEVERLRDALKSCWHAANTYDGNYTAACDNVMTIVNTTLKTSTNARTKEP